MNMNRRTIVACAAMMSALAATALESRQLEVEEGHSETVDLGFAPSGYKQQSGSEFVSVMLAPGASVATVTGVKEGGRSQIEFPDPSGEGVLFTVEVVSDLQKTLIRLRRMLSDFDGLQFSKGSSKILIDGTIGNPTDWEKFNRILKLSDFKGKTESIVEFSVDPGTIGNLRKEFEAEGFKLVAPGEKPGQGELALKYEHNVLSLSGHLWSQKDLGNALSILKSQSWLKIVDESSSDAASKPIVQTVVNIAIDDSILELGVAFVVISKEDIKRRDVQYDLSLSAVWGGIKDFVIGGHKDQRRIHSYSDDFTFNAGLGATLNFFAKNEFSREQQYGTMRFHSNGDFGKTFHVGGTLKVTPPASGEGEAPSPQDFEYGFKIVNKNSHRTGEGSAEADLEIEIKGEPYMPEAAPGTKDLPAGTISIKQETRTFAPTLRIPLGQTVAVAGYEHLVETTMPPTGIPVMRNIPVISWFTSSKKNVKQEYSLLFLVSIRKVDVEAEAPMVPNSAMKDITLDANTPNEERIKAEEEKAQEHRGCWTPLNWFRW